MMYTAHKKFMNTSTTAESVASFILEGRYLENQTSWTVDILKYFISHGPLTDWYIVQNKTSKGPLKSLHNTTAHFFLVSMEVNFKVSCYGKRHIFSFKFDCEYHDDFWCNIGISKISGLKTLFATGVTLYDLVKKWSFCQQGRSQFEWSSGSRVQAFHNGIYRVSEITYEV